MSSDIYYRYHPIKDDKKDIETKDEAKAIAKKIKEATGEHCETLPSATGSAAAPYTITIARTTPPCNAIDVAPLGSPFRGETIEIPMEAQTVDGPMEVAHAIDKATPHVLAAALAKPKH